VLPSKPINIVFFVQVNMVPGHSIRTRRHLPALAAQQSTDKKAGNLSLQIERQKLTVMF
jgi:uncharacterized membrane-anchored protein